MRLFVAVNLPEADRDAVWAACAPLREAGLPVRWAAAGSLHVTLQFLGAVDPAAVEPLGSALASAVAGVRAFEVGLGGFGAFPDLDRPTVLWLGVERHPALELLANDVARALAPLGFAPELRPFRPHVTIGRARRGARASAWDGLEARLGGLEYAAVVPVVSADLMESITGTGGARYRLVRRAVLRAGE